MQCSEEKLVVHAQEGKRSNPEPGLTRRIGAYNDKLFLAEHRMEKNWVGARHSHPHEQMAYVVSGRLKIISGEETFEVGAGDSFLVRGGVEHQAFALEESLVIDIFTPCRMDYV
jgi:quercetin dioxygenase-like cupin family protein